MVFGDFPIKNKIVVVTGGGSGIGLAYATLAHAKGAKVLIGDLQLRKESAALVEKGVIFEKCDVTNWDDLENLVKVSEEKFGDVPDIYIANAGIFEPEWSNFWSNTETQRYASIDINVSHPIKFTRIAVKALLGKKKKGVVSITASVAGYTAIYASPIYSASKHAVVGFTRSMGEAANYQGVKVVAICPGVVKTPLWTDHPASMDRFSVSDLIAISPAEVAQAINMMVEEDKYAGGTILEISKLGTRVIPEWNIDPPGMVDGKMLEGMAVPQEGIDKSIAPILEITKKERGSLTACA